MKRIASKRRLAAAAVMIVAACLATGLSTRCGAEIQPAADAPQPHTPEESLNFFQIVDGFRIEIVASEPHLADPVAMAFDARGRIFVCEIHGYNLEGHLDVMELNKTGVLDKAVRRILANPDAIRRAEQGQYGTVKLLEDTDGDGRVDRSRIWADRLPPCYGVVPAREGVIVLCAPDIVYLADRDGDGAAEIRETLFTGFGIYELWSRINNPRWGLDNWIYVANGNNCGGTIRGPALGEDVEMGSVCFRLKPDGSAIEPVSGSAGGHGQTFNDFGDRFLVTNQQHALFVAPLPHRYLARNPYYAAPNPVVNISGYGHPAKVYPTSQPHPWRRARSKDPAWVKFYGAAEATANGYFTAASGQAIYRATEFPPEYRGNHFSVDNAQNLVHRCLLMPDGAGYTARRPHEDEKTEFLTSSEQWFRPVNLTVGPDGALYIVDMYREIIEDYSAIPRFLQQQYGLIKGSVRGRIYRIVADGAPGPRSVDLTSASLEELIGKLSHSNAWWRQTAQRLLVERGDRAAAGRLEDVAREGPTPQARLHALYTLDGLGALEPAQVERALDDPHFAVRMHALCLAERWLNERPTLLRKAAAMADDGHPRVRLQLAFTLGQSKDPLAVEVLSQLAARYGSDRWMQAAVLSSASDSAHRLAGEIVRRDGTSDESLSLLHSLSSIVGARHQHEEIGSLLQAVAQIGNEGSAPRQVACLDGLIEGLNRGRSQVLTSSAGQLGLRRLLGSESIEVQERALHVAGLVKLRDAPEMKAALAAAAKTALDEARPVQQRQLAVNLLTGAAFAEVAPTAEQLLDARQPLGLQLAAVRVLSSTDDPGVGLVLLARWPSYTPKVQDAVIEAVFGRQNRLPKLLDAIQQGVVDTSGLDAMRRIQLIENPDAEIRRRAKSLLAGRAAEGARQQVVAKYRKALALPRDPQRGKAVYEQQCAKCHRLGDQGFVVGADLSAANNRADETLVSDILDPSNQITVGYRNYTIITEDGRVFTGVLAAETATSVTLRREEAAEDTILRKDIDEMEASALSMMPEGLEKEVSPQDVGDLIAFLRQALGPVPPSTITLFEDDPSFAELLSQGAGKVAMTADDPFSGKASLTVTPPQRWADTIHGWEFPIVENPGPGEFRYLRLAWKSRGEGVLIELADQGRWPPAERSLRRYYSGKNTTGWQAVQVAAEVPQQWVVVTRDLWKDFGEFTLTGIAPTAMGGAASFDRIELLRSLDEVKPGQ